MERRTYHAIERATDKVRRHAHQEAIDALRELVAPATAGGLAGAASFALSLLLGLRLGLNYLRLFFRCLPDPTSVLLRQPEQGQDSKREMRLMTRKL